MPIYRFLKTCCWIYHEQSIPRKTNVVLECCELLLLRRLTLGLTPLTWTYVTDEWTCLYLCSPVAIFRRTNVSSQNWKLFSGLSAERMIDFWEANSCHPIASNNNRNNTSLLADADTHGYTIDQGWANYGPRAETISCDPRHLQKLLRM